MPCASVASNDPPANAISQRLRWLRVVRQRNSKATPRKIRPISIAIIGVYSAGISTA